MALRLVDSGQKLAEVSEVIDPPWPIGTLPDIRYFTAIHAVIMGSNHRIVNLTSALNAVISAANLHWADLVAHMANIVNRLDCFNFKAGLARHLKALAALMRAP